MVIEVKLVVTFGVLVDINREGPRESLGGEWEG